MSRRNVTEDRLSILFPPSEELLDFFLMPLKTKAFLCNNVTVDHAGSFEIRDLLKTIAVTCLSCFVDCLTDQTCISLVLKQSF